MFVALSFERKQFFKVQGQINSLHQPPALSRLRSMNRDQPVTVAPFQLLPAGSVAYEGS